MKRKLNWQQAWKCAALSAVLAASLGSALPSAALAEDAASAGEKLDRNVVLELLSALHVSGTPRSSLEKLSVPGMIDALKDPYTVYFNKEELQNFTSYLEQNYVGIGAIIGLDDKGAYVDKVVPGSPAEAGGLLRDDYIVAVNGIKASTANIADVTDKIMGEEGTAVTLTVNRGGTLKDITLTRKRIQLPVVTSGMFQPNVGYIQVADFSSEAGQKFASQLAELIGKGAKSLVIDLRDNPGGLLTSAQTIAQQFIQDGVLIHTKDRNNEDDPVYIHGGTQRNMPVTVLVNENSASASEVITGALHDYGIAKVVGTRTFGKGSVQQIYNLPSGGALKVTVQEYLTPQMHKVNKVGITPDIEVTGETAQLLTALRTAGLSKLTLTQDKHRLSVNGYEVTDEMTVLHRSGHVYVPTRTVTSLLDGNVVWHEDTRSVDIAALGEKGSYSEAGHDLILMGGFSYVDLTACRAEFPALQFTDSNGVLTLSASLK